MEDELKKLTPAEQNSKTLTQTVKNDAALKALAQALFELRRNKPNDRSDKDRYWAIVITDVEKAMAVFKAYIL